MSDPTPLVESTPPVSPPSEAELPFRRRPMVKWFTPAELARAGVKAVLSKLFGDYADNREIQALRPDLKPKAGDPCAPSPSKDGAPIPTADYSTENEDELWLDYVADLGDGFDPTYAIARLLAAKTLSPVYEPTGKAWDTERGRVLVMGGDQVYPTATREEYQNRLEGPYRAALPWVSETRDTPPHLYAVPGNHDWYDGLTSFTRLFCQGRWIGGWKTRQSRSYFALKLPHDWWLWGIDIQLGADIDEPQLRYFRELARTIEPGAKIILCVAEPTWVEATREGAEAYDNLSVFEAETLRIAGHEHHHVVGLAGDLHAYARYRDENGRQRFISGGGGAYLYPTHSLPMRLVVPNEKPTARKAEDIDEFRAGEHWDSIDPRAPKTPRAKDARRSFWPPRSWSRTRALKSVLLAWYNRSFALFFGAYYLVLVWLTESASKALALPKLSRVPETRSSDAGERAAGALTKEGALNVEIIERGASFLSSAREGMGPMLDKLGEILAHAPGAVLAALVLWGGLWAFAIKGFATKEHGGLKFALGTAHLGLHLLALLTVTWASMQVQFDWLAGFLSFLGTAPGDPGHVVFFSAFVLLVGSFVAGVVWGLYLLLSHAILGSRLFRLDVHSNDVLACQSLPTYKHLLRLRITEEDLTIYPIGLKDMPRGKGWRYQPGVTAGVPWFTYDDGKGEIVDRAVLLEPPIHVQWPRPQESTPET